MIKSFLVVVMAALTLNLGMMELAEAKRMGNGDSFGSKFSQSNSVKRDNTAQREQASPAATANTAQATNDARKQQLASKGGLMGLLGGLAIGGLLGALFFGGAFEGVNFMDILLLALVAFLIYKFVFAKRRAQPQMTPATAGGGQYDVNANTDEQNQYRTTDRDTSGSTASAPAYSSVSGGSAGLDDLRREIPKEFDSAAFLDGAKRCYARLQKAWDEGDLAEIRQFTTDHVFAEIQDQHRAKAQSSVTEILDLDAQLLNVSELGSKAEAMVLFEARLIEDGEETRVSEIWHFTKPSTSLQPTWYLDGIQQVEG